VFCSFRVSDYDFAFRNRVSVSISIFGFQGSGSASAVLADSEDKFARHRSGASQPQEWCGGLKFTRWSTTLSSKVNFPHAINFRAFCDAHFVTLWSNFRPNKSCVLHRTGMSTVVKGYLAHEKTPPLRPYRRPMPRVLGESWGGGRFPMGEVLLCRGLKCMSPAAWGGAHNLHVFPTRVIENPKPETRNRNPQPKAKPETRNPKPKPATENRSLKPATRNPKSSSATENRSPKPIQNPKPS